MQYLNRIWCEEWYTMCMYFLNFALCVTYMYSTNSFDQYNMKNSPGSNGDCINAVAARRLKEWLWVQTNRMTFIVSA